MSRTTSVRLDDTTTQQLDTLATATDRPKAWHLERAIRTYLKGELAFIEAVERGIAQARNGEGFELEEVNDELEHIIADARKPH